MGVTVSGKGLASALASINALTQNEVLIGIPSTDASRDDPGKSGADLTNAAIGYIQETGSPAANIPARPFLVPGVTNAIPKIVAQLKKGATAAVNGDKSAAEKALNAAGLIGSDAAKSVIEAGIMPALASSTLRGRGRAGMIGSAQELKSRKEGNEPGIEYTKPLIVTGQLRDSITYVIIPRDR